MYPSAYVVLGLGTGGGLTHGEERRRLVLGA